MAPIHSCCVLYEFLTQQTSCVDVLLIGTVMALHYESFIAKLKNCPIPLAYGSSGTGKTTAVHCGLGLLGADDNRFFRKVTAAKVAQLCSVSSVPLVVDDPDSKSGFSSILIDLYNGGKYATVGKGEMKPKSTVVISSNIAPIEEER